MALTAPVALDGHDHIAHDAVASDGDGRRVDPEAQGRAWHVERDQAVELERRRRRRFRFLPVGVFRPELGMGGASHEGQRSDA